VLTSSQQQPSTYTVTFVRCDCCGIETAARPPRSPVQHQAKDASRPASTRCVHVAVRVLVIASVPSAVQRNHQSDGSSVSLSLPGQNSSQHGQEIQGHKPAT